MKKLKDILHSVLVKNRSVSYDGHVTGIAIDSRKVMSGYMFIAYKGVHQDGHQYIAKAIEAGCTHVVIEDESYMSEGDVTYYLVDDARMAASRIAANFYNHPSKKLKVIGITGTNGKTTVASMLYEMLRNLDVNAGLVSTIDIKYADKVINAVLTTPDSLSLQELFSDMLETGVTHVVMEVSSHSLHQGRVADIDYDLAVFTNITHDHLDYHGTFSEYIKAKKLLFDNLTEGSACLINLDDKNGEVMAQNSKGDKYSYALKRPAKFKAKVISNEISGLHLDINTRDVFLRMIGRFNAYNALAVYGSAVILGFDPDEVLRVMSNLKSAEGRMDFIQSQEAAYTAVVDYAHTPDALEKVLVTLADVKRSNAKIITVVGAGGNRDKAKRPEMARVAYEKSDLILLTSDNPRDENPEDILNDMINGLSEEQKKKVIKITDRKEAIKMASIMAKPDDIILIAGKGHEKYQEIKGEKFPFDDKKIISALMH